MDSRFDARYDFNYDMTEIISLLKDFYEITNHPVQYFDSKFNKITEYPDTRTLPCALLQNKLEINNLCHQFTQNEGVTAVNQYLRYRVCKCHAGLSEVIALIWYGEISIGYLVLRGLLPTDNKKHSLGEVQNCCVNLKIPQAEALEIVNRCQVISESQPDVLANLLSALTSAIIHRQLVLEKQPSLQFKIDEYILNHYTEQITIAKLCNEFGIGKTKLFDILKKYYGGGLSIKLRYLRLEKAKRLLIEEPDISIQEITERCGFNNYNYFIALFSHTVGMAPRQYQKANISKKQITTIEI